MIMWRRLVLAAVGALLASVIGLVPSGAAASSDMTIRAYDGAVLNVVISSKDSLAWALVGRQRPVPLGVREAERIGGIERLAAKADVGLSSRGLRPAAGTRVRPDGIPEGWRVRPTKGDGGTWYYDPSNKGDAVRVMQGDPKSPFPNSQAPYVRWQRNGQPLDAAGNVLSSKFSPDAHIPLSQFKFRPDLFG